jgi:FlaA1/EpsC-like NDP-sugar epimerase
MRSFAVLNISFGVVFGFFKLYDKLWRYADIVDFFYVEMATIIANLVFFAVTYFVDIKHQLRIYVLLMLISSFFMFIFRLIYRVNKILERKNPTNCPKKRLLIVGAGESAVSVMREISKSRDNEYKPICMVDDDKAKIGRRVSRVKVVGTTNEIPKMCEKYDIELILFAISSIDSAGRKRILDICSKVNLEVRIIPNIYDLVTANISVTSKIRKVEVEDLLGREPIVLDTKQCREYVAEQTVLVTGGGGSIGGELCRQIGNLGPKKLIIFDIYENNAYKIQQELRRNHGEKLNFEVQIGSIRDNEKLENLFAEKKIDVIFHAAAHKHVPLMETNPEEAVKNNIFGTLNLVRVADKYRVKKFVQISTDKAVNPTNVMGATKRICEMIIQSVNDISETEYVAVRFGNVLGSNGSVIPLFKEQIKNGGPVTVTHSEIIRYFMTIPEAVSLVLTAGGIAQGGEIFVLDMGEPVKIKDLAENLIRLSGFVPNEDIKIEYTGLRPGEKLYEELLLDEEGVRKTQNKKIYIGKPIEFNREKFEEDLSLLYKFSKKNDKQKIEKQLREMVPNFRVRAGKHKGLLPKQHSFLR